MRTVIVWWKLASFILGATLMGIIGIGLAETIESINGLGENSLYAEWASYAGISLLFWVLYGGTSFVEKTKKRKFNLRKMFMRGD